MVPVESWGILKVSKSKEEYPMTIDDIILHIFYLAATTIYFRQICTECQIQPSKINEFLKAIKRKQGALIREGLFAGGCPIQCDTIRLMHA
jgi:hypothetical protein